MYDKDQLYGAMFLIKEKKGQFEKTEMCFIVAVLDETLYCTKSEKIFVTRVGCIVRVIFDKVEIGDEVRYVSTR